MVLTERPVSLLNSPAWGVRSVGPERFLSIDKSFFNAVRPSPSIIINLLILAASSRISICVSSFKERPGPKTTQSLIPAVSSIFKRLLSHIEPSAFAVMGTNTTSGAC